MLDYPQKKVDKPVSNVILLGFTIVIISSLSYHFWPDIKALWSTSQAAVILNNNPSLTAISYTQDNPMAIVDGRIVHEQDMLGDVKILKIHRDKVEFESPSRIWTQTMPAMEDAVTSALPVLLQLYSPKCPPCRKMMPILNKMKSDYSRKFQIKYIDAWENPDESLQFGISAVPTQIFYDSKGSELFRHTGFLSKTQILDIWKQCGCDF
jgi:thioredoxin 1